MRLPPEISQSAFAGEIDQVRPAGSGSVMDTPFAWPVPVLESVTVKPIWSPAETLAASAVLVMSIVAQRTSVLAEAVSDPSLEVDTDAVLSTVPQFAFAVVATTWTDELPPASSVVGLNTRLPPEISQSLFAGEIDHVMPAGSGSVKVIPLAWPCPVFDRVTVKPMSSPALTNGASAVFWTSIVAHLTSVEAESVSEPLSVDVTLPVLLIVPQESFVVGLTMWTDLVAPAAIVPKLQLRTPEAIEQEALSGDSDQLRPVLTGSVSLSVTPFAAPAPVFSTDSVKPICSPAETLAASGVFVRSSLPGKLTVDVSVLVLVPALLVAVTLTVLTTCAWL